MISRRHLPFPRGFVKFVLSGEELRSRSRMHAGGMWAIISATSGWPPLAYALTAYHLQSSQPDVTGDHHQAHTTSGNGGQDQLLGPSQGRRTSGSFERPGETARAFLPVQTQCVPPLAQMVKCGRTSWPVSRILCTGRLAASGRRSSISACRCRQALAAYPQASGGPPSIACAARRNRRAFWPCSGWGLPSRPGRPGRWWSLTPPFHPYPGPVDLMGRGGLFSVALSRGSPRVAVSNHPALRSPDFPRRARCRARRDRPASSSAPSA